MVPLHQGVTVSLKGRIDNGTPLLFQCPMPENAWQIRWAVFSLTMRLCYILVTRHTTPKQLHEMSLSCSCHPIEAWRILLLAVKRTSGAYMFPPIDSSEIRPIIGFLGQLFYALALSVSLLWLLAKQDQSRFQPIFWTKSFQPNRFKKSNC